MADFTKIVSILKEVTGRDLQTDSNAKPQALYVQARELTDVCKALYENPELYFDMLSCLTGIDNGPEKATMEVVYNLYSIPRNHSLMLKVLLPRENPEVDSVCAFWRTADWHEREAFDMFGIHFKGHPDLRRILLPADWDGYPLRKDYKEQEYYRGVKVEFSNSYE